MTKEEAYEEVSRMYPGMSEDGKWTQVSVMLNGADVISKQGPNVSPTEDLLRLVLEKAKEWLFEVLPDVFMRVVDFINDLMDSLPEWAKKGIQYAIKVIINYFNS